MVLTLCDRCLQPFLDDRNYTVACKGIVEPREKNDNICFICGYRGMDYEIEKRKAIKKQ